MKKNIATGLKRLTIGFGVLSASLVTSGLAMAAQDFPSRPLTMLVPFTAGGATDVLARTVAEALAKELKQPVVVENVPGAGGSVGQTRAARAAPDGYTVLLGNVGTLAANASLYRNLQYDVLKDFTTVASVGDAPQVLSIRANFPAATLDEFAAYARTNAEKMNFGTAGVGSGSFLGGVLLNAALGTKVPPVHYRGAAQATADVMAGHIDYTIESSSTAVSTISSNKVKGLVVMSDKRVAVLPDVPAASETGFPALRYEIWNMVLVPRGVPAPAVNRLNEALGNVLAEPAMQAKYAQMGLTVPTPDHRSTQGSATLLRDEVARWRKLLDEAGIKPE
ncbi:MAG: tripartite tricarboxylate transporter substrate binding protein [Comamonadaceae bacterium]|nr:MAG: tripartite tricarboxylate transporter substrate binding protein [Comamonadaceae bacterium]